MSFYYSVVVNCFSQHRRLRLVINGNNNLSRYRGKVSCVLEMDEGSVRYTISSDQLNNLKIRINKIQDITPSPPVPMVTDKFALDPDVLEVPTGSLKFISVEDEFNKTGEHVIDVEVDNSSIEKVVQELRERAQARKEVPALEVLPPEQEEIITNKIDPPCSATITSSRQIGYLCPPVYPSSLTTTSLPSSSTPVQTVHMTGGGQTTSYPGYVIPECNEAYINHYQATVMTGFNHQYHQAPSQHQMLQMDYLYAKGLMGLRFGSGIPGGGPTNELLPGSPATRGVYTQIIRRANIFQSASNTYPGNIKIKAHKKYSLTSNRKQHSYYSPYELRRWQTVPITQGEASPEYAGSFTYAYDKTGLYYCSDPSPCGSSPTEVNTR